MKALRVFGSLDLRDPDGEAIDPVLSQPKRCALLAYLAVARPRGLHRRDTLLGLFWPESDDEHARAALSTSLSFLRRSLGQEVIVTRGIEEVGLEPDAIQADVWAFEDALEAGRVAEALEEYRGHLLEGFFLSGCPGFDEWLEGERQRLRRRAAGAAWDAAMQRVEGGDPHVAERLGHQALALGGPDESAVRAFMQALVGAGDRALAVRFYERFARALARDLGLRPSADTRRLVEKARMSKGGGADAAAISGRDGGRSADASVLNRLRASLADRYFIEAEIGRGGMATVYVAHDLKHERKVAVKVLDPDLAATLGTDRFLREIKTAAKLAHPHILPLLDSGRADDLLYYVMPHVEGESLRARLDREGQLPVEDAARIAGEIADALAFAHERNVLHRDVKPSNILLEAGHAVLADFGVARALAEADEEKLARTDGAKTAGAGQTHLTYTGTPAYMSPEQASGERELDGRSDQYALACVAYEMLTGKPPVADESVRAVLEKKQRADYRSLEEVRPGLPPELGTALKRALATDPVDRFASASEFADALAVAAWHERGPGSKRRWLRWAGTAAMAAVVALAWYVGASRSGAPSMDGGEGLNPNLVAVLPFTVQGGEELAIWKEGMGTLLAYAVDGAGELSAVDPRAVRGSVQREPLPGPLDPESGREIAARFGAGSFVLGELIAGGGEIRAVASLYGARGEPETTAVAMVAEEGQILSDLVDEVARQLVVGRADVAGDPFTRVGAVTTGSLTALKAYLRGEALVSSAFLNPAVARSAVAEYRQAVEADSTFALAYLRMRLVDSYTSVPLDTRDALEPLRRFSDRLPPQDRRLLECYLAFGERRDERDAERLCSDVRRRDPNNADALFILGDAMQHYGLRRGRTIAEVREVYDRALELGPSHSYPVLLNHRGWIARVEEDFETWAEYQELWAQINWPSPSARQYQLAVDAWRGDERALDQLIAAVADEPGSFAWPALIAMETWPIENRSATIRILRAITAPGQSRDLRADGHMGIAQEELAAGRLSAARTEMAEARALDSYWSHVSRVYLMLSPYLPVSEDEFRVLRDEVTGWSPAEPGIRVWQLYLLGLLDERLGDRDEAERYASDLQVHSTKPNTEDVTRAEAPARDLALYLRARLAAGAGRHEEAWRLLEETAPERWWPMMSLVEPHGKQLYERWLAAEVLVALGRPNEALNWLAGIGMDGERSYMGIRHLRMAEIYEGLGNREKATYHYGRFVTYWKDADPELQWRVEQAQRRIEALSVER